MTEHKPKSAAELRKFGFVMTAAWSLIGALLWWRGKAAASWFLGLAAVFLVPALLYPLALAPVERAWMKVAELISAVMTRVVLTLTFFLIITPLAVIRRLMGHDTLGLRPDRAALTYWVPVEPDGPAGRPDKPY